MMAEEMSIEKLVEDFNFFSEVQGKFLTLNEVSFKATICMLMEVYCKEHDIDVVEMSEDLAITVRKVVKEFGRY